MTTETEPTTELRTTVTPVASFTMTASELRSALSRVQHAASVGRDARPILNSILIEAAPDGLRFVAADNYRIAVLTVAADVEGEWPRTVVPLDEVPALMAKLKAWRSGRVVVERHPLTIEVGMGLAGSITCRLVDGTYPNYAQVIPPDPPHRVSLNPKYLAGVVKGTADTVEVAFAGPLEPVVLADGDGYLECIMPVRTASTFEPLP